MKNKHLVLMLLISLFGSHLFAQIAPNFKPFTKNSSFARANESSIRDLLDTTIKRFLFIANDTASETHKTIQEEFRTAKMSDRLQSFIYPKKLRKSNLTLQFIDWSHDNGLYGVDSFFQTESLNAMVFIPVMYEDQKGTSVTNLCFKTGLEINDISAIGDSTSKPKVIFKIEKADL